MYFKDTINALGHTPLVELSRLNPNPKVKIIAKLEGQNTGGSASVKDRIARYMIEDAERTGKLTKDKTILEATSGNTGIAIAWLAHLKGYKTTIVMPDSMSMERRQILKMFGAELILTKGADKMNGAIRKAYDMAAKDKRYFMPDQFSNPANPLAHYETTGTEILNDFPDKIDYLVFGIGTGGTITGVTRKVREKFPNVKCIGVEPLAEDPIQGLRCLDDFIPPVIDLSLITQRTIVRNVEAVEATLQLLRLEGIFAGVSAGAAVHRCIKLAESITGGNIVTVLPDSGWKYLSLDMWKKLP